MTDATFSPRICVACQKEIPDESVFCPYCGHDYSPPTVIERGTKASSVLPVIGGLAIFAAGFIGFGNGMLNLLGTETFLDYEMGALLGLQYMHGVILIISGIIGMIAGRMAMQRRNIVFSLAGGFVSLGVAGFSIYIVGSELFYSSEIALVGIILVAIAYEEFDS